jgi:hypothetical protein
MGSDAEINLYVSIHAGCPELQADLIGVPRRLRAERLRTLATLGLTGVRGAVSAAGARTTRDPASAPADPQHARKVRLLERLGS